MEIAMARPHQASRIQVRQTAGRPSPVLGRTQEIWSFNVDTPSPFVIQTFSDTDCATRLDNLVYSDSVCFAPSPGVNTWSISGCNPDGSCDDS
jgi:hypothetical protein